MIGFLLSFLPIAQLATLWAAIHYRAKAAEWKAQWATASRAALEAQALLASLQEDVQKWKDRSIAAQAGAAQAVLDAQKEKAYSDALVAKIQAQPVPPDAEGALAWLAEIGQQLKQGAGR